MCRAGSLRSGEQVLRVSILFTLHLTVNPRSARPLMILDYGLNSIWMLSSTKGGLLLSLSFSAWCVSLFSVWPSEIDVFTWHHKHAGCSHLLIRTVWHSQADTRTDAHDSSCTSFPVASQRCVFDHHIFQFKQRLLFFFEREDSVLSAHSRQCKIHTLASMQHILSQWCTQEKSCTLFIYHFVLQFYVESDWCILALAECKQLLWLTQWESCNYKSMVSCQSWWFWHSWCSF